MEHGFKTVARFQKTIIGGIVNTVVPFQPICKCCATDIAGTDKCCPVQMPVLIEMRKKIGLHVKATTARFKYPYLCALRLQQHEVAQCLGVGHIEVIAGHNPQARSLP